VFLNVKLDLYQMYRSEYICSNEWTNHS